MTSAMPTAWRGREQVVRLILRARAATKRTDVHYPPMSALVVSCFGETTFPSAETLNEALEQVSAAIARQIVSSPSESEQDRLLEVVELLSEALAERKAVP